MKLPGLASVAAVVLVPFLAETPVRAGGDGKTVETKSGLVVSVSAPGSTAGLGILKQGGNAVDAAVATAFALAVTYPAAGNIGGGGFMVVHPGQGAAPVVFEYRETAPAAATREMFVKEAPVHGPRIVGVPGTVRGLALAHKRFGKLAWDKVMRPAIRLADEGFAIDAPLARSLNKVLASSKDFPELRRVYGKPSGSQWERGDRLVQKDLARTLRQIAEEGPDAFYKGQIAQRIVAEMEAGGGLITRADLAGYHANERQPIHGRFRGYDVYAPPPPSSGGICLVEMLNILEECDLRKHGRWSPQTIHFMIEAMRRAYCDRARYLGDPAFVKVPDHLTSKEYAQKLARGIDPNRATASATLAPDITLAAEGDSTTHFSVIDKDGMAVANTYTLEQSYGSRVVVKGAGFLLNNEMLDFNRRPGHTDRKGAIGTPANLIAPGKRMLSSQTPTIVARDGKVVLVTGSPGSRTIPNTVLCVVLNVLEFDMEIRAAVNAPRLHHQWFPDQALFEGADAHPRVVKQLRKMGHDVVGKAKQGDAHSIWLNARTGWYVGAADHRQSGSAVGLSPVRQAPRYEVRQDHDPDGIGKFYMGREIAQVMGHQAADWLERPEREKEEAPSKMLTALKLKPGDVVADVGAGSGYHTFRMSKMVGPKGKIYAVDIQPEMLAIIRARMKTGKVSNVIPVKGTVTDPRLPAGAIDMGLMVDVYHEFDHPFEMTQALVKALKPGGRLVFVEFRLEDPNVPIKLVHRMSQKQVLKEMEPHPLRYRQSISTLPWQHVIIFEKLSDDVSGGTK
jgi:gamma-glutamyltranspeptidase/glutathione hydrolase